jgi:cobalt/nickel transport system ATP-binding protein
MIELRNVSCTYGEGSALAGIDLRIRAGEALAVLGPNGCGKSTLLKLLNGLVPARTGSYRFAGDEISPRRLQDPRAAKAFHQRIGLLFQNSDTQLFCPVVEDEIGFGPRQMGLPEPEVAQRVADCLDLLGIASLRTRVPYHLSAGEKRMVALASVLALNPEVLVLDEPLNGLDPRRKRFLGQLLGQLQAAGKTLICATHDFQNLEGVFQTALVLGEDHRVARIGPYAEVIADQDFLRSQNIL